MLTIAHQFVTCDIHIKTLWLYPTLIDFGPLWALDPEEPGKMEAMECGVKKCRRQQRNPSRDAEDFAIKISISMCFVYDDFYR